MTRADSTSSASVFQTGDGGSTPTSALHFSECSVAEVSGFFTVHYLKRRPSVVRFCAKAVMNGEGMGCITFSEPPAQTNTRYGGPVLELSRLFLLDSAPKNSESRFSAWSLRAVAKKFPDKIGVVSYADPSAGHRGVIYRASNFRYDEMTDAGRKTPRCDYYCVVTGKKYSRKAHVPFGAKIERRPRVSKHRYFFPFHHGSRA
jgi:hypothetical protein